LYNSPSGPSIHRRDHTDPFWFDMIDRICDAYMMQLWNDIVTLDNVGD
jgi:hypothetical protein